MQFRRTLLNKCQEEFEAGQAAMKAVNEREKHKKGDTEGPEEQEQVGRAAAWGACLCVHVVRPAARATLEVACCRPALSLPNLRAWATAGGAGS